MELPHDWRSFQNIFHAKRRSLTRSSAAASGPVFVILDEKKVLSAYSEGEDFTGWIGKDLEGLLSEHAHRSVVSLSREQVDQWLAGSLGYSHFFAQVEHLRRHVFSEVHSIQEPWWKHHFLLEALQGWWARILPATYAIFIRLEGQGTEDLLLVLQRGKVAGFMRPEVSSMGSERSRDPEALVKYLSEKHSVPVMGLFIPQREWLEWSESTNPWSQVLSSVRQSRTRLVPGPWAVKGLICAKAWLGW